MARVLIVDDQEHVRKALRAMFESHEPQWELSEAEDGRQAVEFTRSIKPDVVVMDIVMDGMNGVAAACEIRQTAPAAKLVLISSHYTSSDASVLSRLLGVGAFVQKADAGTVLIPTIKRLLRTN
ncbi:MAG TPA: response regulator transcription factor [Candidatus Acidoferrales bacterium]|nr:response regulator transcription factor [Candidatus Acidoferrales bacterium]